MAGTNCWPELVLSYSRPILNGDQSCRREVQLTHLLILRQRRERSHGLDKPIQLKLKARSAALGRFSDITVRIGVSCSLARTGLLAQVRLCSRRV